MLIWGQWDLVFNFWVSCVSCGFCDNETLFFISESPVAFVTLFPWCSNESLWEMLIWGQWDLVFNFWVSCVSCGFCDAVAPDVQMRLCGKCWFEGNETLFLISESPVSPVAFVTLLPLMFKWEFVGNVNLRAMTTLFLISESPVSPVAFVTLLPLMFKWEFVGNVDLRAMRPCF